LAVTLWTDPFPSNAQMNELSGAAWGDDPEPKDFSNILRRSLAHVGAYERERLIGVVNVAWDGGIHAFTLDTCVHPDFRRRGVATRLVKETRQRGAHWLHVDFEAHLAKFHEGCGFRPTKAGLIDLRSA
jgi:GNAT superfamily N-acetyltransferase